MHQLRFSSLFICFNVLLCSTFTYAQDPIFSGNTSATWEEAIARYQQFAEEHPNATFQEIGATDIGKPLHVFIVNGTSKKPIEFSNLRQADKPVLLVNNGIHPGEPCGVDASLQMVERLLTNPSKEREKLLEKVTLMIVPIYNVGGALNRGCCSRANQNGPDSYGFRGNAKNLDLNRDFIKADSENAKALTAFFNTIKPHVFIDTHTSNGADYQYVMTMINTQPDKASESIGNYIKEEMSPALYKSMEERGFGMTPYVYSLGKTPESGIKDFLETPRYSTGYAALFNCIGYTSETHMLKPFAQRVESTYQFLMSTLEYMAHHDQEILDLKANADEAVKNQKSFPLNWSLDTTYFDLIPFNGFEAEYPESEVTGEKRLKYNQQRPFTRKVKYFNKYKVTKEVEAPKFYIVSQAWKEVIERLGFAGVEMSRLKADTIIQIEAYVIDQFESGSRVYEGHHMNKVELISKQNMTRTFYAGDYLIQVNQTSNRYIVEMLEPEGVDAFFVWNFFDSAFQQKEWYSEYVFEDTAADLLAANTELEKEFEQKKKEDFDFASSAQKQLYWLYTQSAHYEPSLNVYPVFRWNP